MQPPCWDDPITSACREAAPTILRGLQVRPTLYGFVDDEPVVRVQPNVATSTGGVPLAQQHLMVVPAVLGLEQALILSQARLRDERVGDPDVRDALATYAITVEVARRDGDTVTTELYLIEREVVDGRVRWEPPIPFEPGMWTDVLRQALAPPPAVSEAEMPPATMFYALSRAGTVVEVAPGWRERFGADRLDHRQVRAVDRRRTRRAARYRSAATRQRPRREVGA